MSVDIAALLISSIGHGLNGLATKALCRLPRVSRLDTCAPAALQQTAHDLAARGFKKIILLPCMLEANHESPSALLDQVRSLTQEFPKTDFIICNDLGNESLFEDLLVERVSAFCWEPADQPVTGKEIEALSHGIIDRRLERENLAPDTHAIVRRVIHATADFSFAATMRIHEHAILRGVKALTNNMPVICDSTILLSGITRTASEVICAIRDPEVIDCAKQHKTTRAAAAMHKLAERMDNAIVAIGNAPTALWKVMEMADSGRVNPAVIVGLPVGFVGAREAKTALAASELCYITNLSPRGGSPAAAAAVNALALLAKEAVA